MKKILFPLISIFAAVALVAGSAYSLLSTNAQVNGVSFETRGANLLISVKPGYFDKTVVDPGDNFQFKGLYPGYVSESQKFSLRNTLGAVPLNITGSLDNVTEGEDWYILQNVVQVGVSATDDASGVSKWYYLKEWREGRNGVDYVLPGNPLNIESVKEYYMFVKVPLKVGGIEVGNEITYRELTGLSFVFTGTQAI